MKTLLSHFWDLMMEWRRSTSRFSLSWSAISCIGPLPERESYRALLKDIKAGVLERAEKERNSPEKLNTMGPAKVHGKPILPLNTTERFVVRVTNSKKQSVCYLFNWSDLYNVGFYVDDAEDESNRCWYVGTDLDESMLPSILPPRDQFPYVPIFGQGLYLLPTNSSYESIGTKNIQLGKQAIDDYVSQLFTIRSKMTRFGSKGQKLSIDEDLRKVLLNGPLSFAAVVISEPSRFEDYQNYMKDNIYMNIEVPELYTRYFTDWSDLSTSFRDGLGHELAITGTEETVVITAKEVRAKIALVCSSILRK